MNVSPQIVKYFQIWQKMKGKYLDFDIGDVVFKYKPLFDIVSLSNGSEFPSGYTKRKNTQGNIPLISAGAKTDMMGYIKSLIGNNKAYPKEHYVYNDTKSKYNKVKHYIDNDYYTITADGYAGNLKLRKSTDYPNGFYTTNVCKVVEFVDKHIAEQYFLYAYKIEKEKHSFGFGSKANNANLSKIDIPIPKPTQDKTSLQIQQIIVEFLDYWSVELDLLAHLYSPMMDKIYELGDGMRDRIFSNTKDPFLLERFDMWLLEHQGDNPIKDIKFEDIKFEDKKIISDDKSKQICYKKMGFTPDRVEYGDINWFTVADLTKQDGLYIDNPNTKEKTTMELVKKKVDSKNTGNSEKLVPIKKGDILVSFLLTIGCVKIYNSSMPAYCNQAIDILTLKDGYDAEYVAINCELEYPKCGEIQALGKNLNDSEKAKINIPIPKPTKHKTSLEIQKLLARFLQDYDTWSSDMKRLHIKMGQKSAQMRDLLISHTFGADT